MPSHETHTPVTDIPRPDSKIVFGSGFEADFDPKPKNTASRNTPEDGVPLYPSTANYVPLAEQPVEYEPYWHQPSPDPTEAHGLAVTEVVGQLAVEPDVVVVSGLRARIAHRRANKAEEKAKKASTKAQYRRGAYRRIIKGEEFPFGNSMVDMLPPTPLDKLDRLAREIRHPNRVPQTSDGYGSITSWWESRLNRRQLNRRAKRRMHEMEAEITLKRHGKPLAPRDNNRDFSVAPSLETYDLDTEQGWRRLYSRPVTGLEVRGHRRAIERVHHAEHVAHSINERAERPVERAERKANKQQEKATKLRNRVELIANREDALSKTYDKSKEQAVRAGKWTGRNGIVRPTKFTVRKFDASIKGYAAAPGAFHEGRQGTNVPDTRTQRTINKTARGVGLAIGTVKREYKPSNIKRSVQRDMESIRAWRANRAAEAGRPTKDERKRQKQAAKARRQAQNRRGVL